MLALRLVGQSIQSRSHYYYFWHNLVWVNSCLPIYKYLPKGGQFYWAPSYAMSFWVRPDNAQLIYRPKKKSMSSLFTWSKKTKNNVRNAFKFDFGQLNGIANQDKPRYEDVCHCGQRDWITIIAILLLLLMNIYGKVFSESGREVFLGLLCWTLAKVIIMTMMKMAWTLLHLLLHFCLWTTRSRRWMALAMRQKSSYNYSRRRKSISVAVVPRPIMRRGKAKTEI